MNTLKAAFNAAAPGAVCSGLWFTAMTLYSNAASHDMFFTFGETTRETLSSNFGYAALAITAASVLGARQWYKAREQKASPSP